MKPEIHSMAPNQSKRSTVLVDREFQIYFSFRLGTILLASMGLFLALSVVSPAAFGMFSGTPDWEVLETMLQGRIVLYAVILPLIGTFLALFGFGIQESFRIAGPNGRFLAVFRSLKHLEIPRGVHIRKDDYLQDSARELDSSLRVLHGRVHALKVLGKDAQDALESIPSSELKSTETLQSAIADLNHLLDQFQLSGESPGGNSGEQHPQDGPVMPMEEEAVAQTSSSAD